MIKFSAWFSQHVVMTVSVCYVICVGLEPEGVCALAPARFTVETFSAGRGEITVEVVNEEGEEEEVKH